MIPAPLEPCPRCGVRADVGCKHQAPAGPPPTTLPTKPDRRFGKDALNGMAFHRDRVTSSAVKRAAELFRPVS